MTVTDTTAVRIIKERRPRSPRVVIRTTPEIIDRALPKESGHCIWADAVKEAVPNASRVSVDLATIRFTDPDKGCRYTYLTPRTIQVDLVNFDYGVKPEPKAVRLRGGQVSKAGSASAKPSPGMPPIPSKTVLVDRDPAKGTTMERVGGRTPPLAAYGNVGGRRREFGLRGLGRVTVENEKITVEGE